MNRIIILLQIIAAFVMCGVILYITKAAIICNKIIAAFVMCGVILYGVEKVAY